MKFYTTLAQKAHQAITDLLRPLHLNQGNGSMKGSTSRCRLRISIKIWKVYNSAAYKSVIKQQTKCVWIKNSLTLSYQVRTLSESATPATTSKTTSDIRSASKPSQLPLGINIRTRPLSWKMKNRLWEWPRHVPIRMIVQSGSRTCYRPWSDKKSNRASI